MTAKHFAALFALSLAFSTPALADYVVKDGNGVLKTIKSNTIGGSIIAPVMMPIDASGAAFGVSGNPFAVAPGAGAVFHTICDSGCAGGGGGDVNISEILGAPVSVTNPLFISPAAGATFAVSIASMPSTPVTGAFWPYTLGQQLAAGSVPVILPAATIATLTPPAAITGFALAANQTNASQKTQIVDGAGAVIGSTSNNLNVQCANCSGSGVSTADGATFAAGASLFAGSGGIFQTTATSNPVVNGKQGLFQMTAQRALFVNPRDSSGVEIVPATAALQSAGNASLAMIATNSAAAAPLNVNGTVTAWTGLTPGIAQTGTIVAANFDLSSLAGTALGAPVNYGAAPGAVKALNANVFLTGGLAVAAAGQGATGATAPTGATLSGATAQSAEATAVTGGQMKSLVTDLVGKLINLPYANPENTLNGEITSAMTATTSTPVTGMGAQGAGIRNYVTACTLSNTHATVDTMINLQDGSGGAVLWQAPAAHLYNGAVTIFPTPIKTTANTGLFAVNATTGANTLLSCTGYKGI